MEKFPIKVLVEPGKTISLEELSKKEQEEIKIQIKMISELSKLEIKEEDEYL